MEFTMIKPDPSDCCNSGCNPCILDFYEEQLKKYETRKESEKSLNFALHNCISPTSYTIFQLDNIEKHADSTYFYTFKYVKPEKGTESLACARLSCGPGKHFLLKASRGEEHFTRAYTPISVEGDKFSILVKLYPDGIMSKYLKELQMGQETLWRGPYGDFVVSFHSVHTFFIAQGTGIAPVYCIIKEILKNEECYSFIKLYFCCSNCDNIFLREDLYKLSANWNFSYEVFINDTVNYNVKYNETIHKEKLQLNKIEHYVSDKLQDNLQIIICGSESFGTTMKNYVLNCNIKSENIFTL